MRIETFRKVVEFSVGEAKGLKIKLLGVEDLDDATLLWRKTMIEHLNNALLRYEKEQLFLLEETINDVEIIKRVASDFKTWREALYIPIAEEINEFLLTEQEEVAIETALKRWQRINKDVASLENSGLKGVKQLRELLNAAKTLIDESDLLNKEARVLFVKQRVTPLLPKDKTSEINTEIDTIEAEGVAILLETETAPNVTSTTGSETASTTLAAEAPQPPTIKSLVRESLAKVKGAYQTFIEMSDLVRKLLE